MKEFKENYDSHLNLDLMTLLMTIVLIVSFIKGDKVLNAVSVIFLSISALLYYIVYVKKYD
ncbi:hypothetical protein CUU66_19670 [Peribacillus deserti]|uniref:Uncharacterized protein n=1 Tax=Peribacillus deserti TaxID=673318 RepID=A0A2N5M1C4_9BACI|nr:hypothetical protein CUU66_19670 [Peribacillus deserti]